MCFMLFILFLICLYLFKTGKLPVFETIDFNLSLWQQNFLISLLNKGLSSGRIKTLRDGMKDVTSSKKVEVNESHASSTLPADENAQFTDTILRPSVSKLAFYTRKLFARKKV